MATLSSQPIDPDEVARRVARPGAGAIVTFSGSVRDERQGRRVVRLDYHAHEPLALKEMGRIEDEVRRRWPEARAAIAHRLGLLEIGELSVVIAVSSPHRAEAFDAARHAIEALKESVPIWKREVYTDGHAWIEGS